jgi:hypothetical protein
VAIATFVGLLMSLFLISLLVAIECPGKINFFVCFCLTIWVSLMIMISTVCLESVGHRVDETTEMMCLGMSRALMLISFFVPLVAILVVVITINDSFVMWRRRRRSSLVSGDVEVPPPALPVSDSAAAHRVTIV